MRVAKPFALLLGGRAEEEKQPLPRLSCSCLNRNLCPSAYPFQTRVTALMQVGQTSIFDISPASLQGTTVLPTIDLSNIYFFLHPERASKGESVSCLLT